MSDNKNNKNKIRDTITTFSSDGLKGFYSGDYLMRLGLKASQASGRRGQRGKSLTEQINDAKTATELRQISKDNLTHQGYSDIINYFKTMFLYRYMVVPIEKDEDITESKMEIKIDPGEKNIVKVSSKMLEAVEGLDLESTLPHLIETGIIEGYVTIYLERIDDRLVPFPLPNDYSEPFLTSPYGTRTVVFDLDYFDNILQDLSQGSASEVLLDEVKGKDNNNRESQDAVKIKKLMSYYPKELEEAYKAYAKYDDNYNKDNNAVQGPQYIQLDSSKAAIIPFSPSLAPPKIKSLAAEDRYNKTVDIELQKSNAGLEKIFTHKIPIDQETGQPIFTLVEAKAIQESMSTALSGSTDIKVLTTFGDTNLHEAYKDMRERSAVLKDAFDSQYEVSSMNPQLFRANTDYALSVSLGRNEAFVWDILQKIMKFYNVSINSQFDFGSFVCQISLLPITVYNEVDQIDLYRKSAEFGIGKLEAVIAPGTKQISLVDKLNYEKALNLDELLTPLQSSHTQSGKPEKVEEVKEVEIKEEKDKEVKEDVEKN